MRRYHGCPHIFTTKRNTRIKGLSETPEMLYRKTCKIDSLLKRKLPFYTVMWECEWQNKLKNQPELRKEVLQIKKGLIEPVNIRDCFYGGR